MDRLTRSVWRCIAALRASLESMAVRTDAQVPGPSTVRGALDEVGRLTRKLHALVDFAHPGSIQARPCSPKEIALGGIATLDERHRDRVRLEEGTECRFLADGPRLIRCFAYALESALDASVGDVRFETLLAGSDVSFVVRGTTGSSEPDFGHAPELPIGTALAARDIRRMGGRVAMRSEPGTFLVSAIFPALRDEGTNP